MATVNKDFRIKHGLVVEGTTGTINGEDILTTGSTTDDLGEGTNNKYFTDERAKDSAAALLTGATLTNITITGDGTGLTITAENGVDDATTDDLTEGTTNKYFTDQRAIDAVTGGIDTDDIVEGTTNKYFTDTRVRDALSGGTGIDYNGTTGEIAVDTDTIATREYVDAATAGLNVHDSVKAATVANINLATDLENGDLLDGVTLATGNRVLVKDQTTKSQNGIYVVQISGAAVRATDYNEVGEVDAGDFVFVEGGIANGKTGWVQVNTIGTIGGDDIEFTQFSGAGTYQAGTGIALNGNTFSVDFTEFDADDISEGTTNKYYTDQKVSDVIATKTTDDIDEGTNNKYYTDQRVKDVLTGSTQTNISITEVGGALVITAENGVDDATTDDLDEGTTNKYFTDQRAVDAIEAVVPNLTAVEINSVAKNVAFTTLVDSSTAPEAVATFAKASYRSAKFLVKASFGNHTHVSEVLLTLDSSDGIAITEFAMVMTDGSLMDITADISGTDVRLLADVSNNNTTVKVFGTLLA